MTNTSRMLIAVCAAMFSRFGGWLPDSQDMADQPKSRPLSPSPFFDDGRSERPLLENTVAHGSIVDDESIRSEGFECLSAYADPGTAKARPGAV